MLSVRVLIFRAPHRRSVHLRTFPLNNRSLQLLQPFLVTGIFLLRDKLQRFLELLEIYFPTELKKRQ